MGGGVLTPGGVREGIFLKRGLPSLAGSFRTSHPQGLCGRRAGAEIVLVYEER